MLKRINTEIKQAMREKNTVMRDILRMVVAKAKLTAKNENDREVTNEDILSTVRKQIKENKDSVDALKEAGRIFEKEVLEIEVLSEYLPAQMPAGEMQKIVTDIVSGIPEDKRNMKSKGIVMGKLSKYRDSLDMKEAGNFADTLLVG